MQPHQQQRKMNFHVTLFALCMSFLLLNDLCVIQLDAKVQFSRGMSSRSGIQSANPTNAAGSNNYKALSADIAMDDRMLKLFNMYHVAEMDSLGDEYGPDNVSTAAATTVKKEQIDSLQHQPDNINSLAHVDSWRSQSVSAPSRASAVTIASHQRQQQQRCVCKSRYGVPQLTDLQLQRFAAVLHWTPSDVHRVFENLQNSLQKKMQLPSMLKRAQCVKPQKLMRLMFHSIMSSLQMQSAPSPSKLASADSAAPSVDPDGQVLLPPSTEASSVHWPAAEELPSPTALSFSASIPHSDTSSSSDSIAEVNGAEFILYILGGVFAMIVIGALVMACEEGLGERGHSFGPSFNIMQRTDEQIAVSKHATYQSPVTNTVQSGHVTPTFTSPAHPLPPLHMPPMSSPPERREILESQRHLFYDTNAHFKFGSGTSSRHRDISIPQQNKQPNQHSSRSKWLATSESQRHMLNEPIEAEAASSLSRSSSCIDSPRCEVAININIPDDRTLANLAQLAATEIYHEAFDEQTNIEITKTAKQLLQELKKP